MNNETSSNKSFKVSYQNFIVDNQFEAVTYKFLLSSLRYVNNFTITVMYNVFTLLCIIFNINFFCAVEGKKEETMSTDRNVPVY